MNGEMKNYLKYRTICPVPYECMMQRETIMKQDVVVRNTDIKQTSAISMDISSEKKEVIGQLVTVLQRVARKQENQHRKFVHMLRMLNMDKNTRSSGDNVVSQTLAVKEETVEDKLRKAEKRVQELETLLKKMEEEKMQRLKKVKTKKKNIR